MERRSFLKQAGAGLAVGAVAVFMVVWLRLNHARLAGWDRELDRLASDDGSGRANR